MSKRPWDTPPAIEAETSAGMHRANLNLDTFAPLLDGMGPRQRGNVLAAWYAAAAYGEIIELKGEPARIAPLLVGQALMDRKRMLAKQHNRAPQERARWLEEYPPRPDTRPRATAPQAPEPPCRPAPAANAYGARVECPVCGKAVPFDLKDGGGAVALCRVCGRHDVPQPQGLTVIHGALDPEPTVSDPPRQATAGEGV